MSGGKTQTNEGHFGLLKDPFKKQPYVDPLRIDKKTYKDPVSVSKDDYIDPVKTVVLKIPEYRPYDSYHEYTMPDIDPLTGKPRKRKIQRSTKQEKSKESRHEKTEAYFPSQLGSSVGSIKRMLTIQADLNI